MKDKLMEALGGFGMILYFFLCILFVAIPMAAADLPFLVTLVVLLLMYFTNYIGAILSVLIYVYATIVVLSHPIGWFSIVFFVDMALYAVFCFIPGVLQIITIFMNNRRR